MTQSHKKYAVFIVLFNLMRQAAGVLVGSWKCFDFCSCSRAGIGVSLLSLAAPLQPVEISPLTRADCEQLSRHFNTNCRHHSDESDWNY